MTFYITSYSPEECAGELDDVLLRHAPMQVAQALSNAMLIGPLPPRDVTSDFSVWVKASSGNYRWSLALFVALLNEYAARFEKDHAAVSFAKEFSEYAGRLEDGEVTQPFPGGNPDEQRATLQAHWQRVYDDGRIAKRNGVGIIPVVDGADGDGGVAIEGEADQAAPEAE